MMVSRTVQMSRGLDYDRDGPLSAYSLPVVTAACDANPSLLRQIKTLPGRSSWPWPAHRVALDPIGRLARVARKRERMRENRDRCRTNSR